MDENIEKAKGKKTRKRLTALERMHEGSRHETPGHSLARAVAAEMQPDECKSAAEMAADAVAHSPGNPADVPDFNRQRAGESPARVAVGHVDLRQQGDSPFNTARERLQANPYNFIGGTGFNSAFGFTDRPKDAPGDNVDVNLYDPAGDSGGYRGMQPIDTSPRQPVAAYEQHRDSGTRDNGSHSLTDVESRAVSNKSRLDIMKDCLFGD